MSTKTNRTKKLAGIGGSSDPSDLVKNISKCECKKCKKEVKEDQKSMNCNKCKFWLHLECTNLTTEEYQLLARGNEAILWLCQGCLKDEGEGNAQMVNLSKKIDKIMMALGSLNELTVKVANLEASLLKTIDSKIDKKFEEKFEEVKKDIEIEINEHIEEKEEREKRKLNLVLS